MLIDKYLPEYHFFEKHTIEINATNEHILNAIIDLCPKEISFLFRLLFFIRSIPPKILRKNHFSFCLNSPLIMQLEEKGFKILETNNEEIVIGIINQNRKIKKEELSQKDDFINFRGKESAKIATNFFLVESKGKVIVSTETRIYTTDLKVKRKFAMYWMIVYPGSALIRKIWLKAIKKRAESYADYRHEKLRDI
jgi:hypothetical protein